MLSKYANHFWSLVNNIQSSVLVPRKIRALILRSQGVTIGENSSISPHCHLGPNLSIGTNSFINVHCLIETGGKVKIGNCVHLAMRVTIVTTSHEIGPADYRCGPYDQHPVTIENGAWIGACVTILPGVTIGRGSVIAAGALVTRDTEPNCLYAGIPARRIKDLRN
jgi:acetyltransferase-like isoleucine patch superfamily enzyme